MRIRCSRSVAPAWGSEAVHGSEQRQAHHQADEDPRLRHELQLEDRNATGLEVEVLLRIGLEPLCEDGAHELAVS